MLTAKDFSGILTVGGTILGTSSRSNWCGCRFHNGLDRWRRWSITYHNWIWTALWCLVETGHIRQRICFERKVWMWLHFQRQLTMIYGEQIFYDIWFPKVQVDIATNTSTVSIQPRHLSRVFIVEVMGHKVGWVTCIRELQEALILSFASGDSVWSECDFRRLKTHKSRKTLYDYCSCGRNVSRREWIKKLRCRRKLIKQN